LLLQYDLVYRKRRKRNKRKSISINGTGQIEAGNNNWFQSCFASVDKGYKKPTLVDTKLSNNIGGYWRISYILVEMLNDMIIVVDSTDEKPERMEKKEKQKKIIHIFYQIYKRIHKKRKYIQRLFMLLNIQLTSNRKYSLK